MRKVDMIIEICRILSIPIEIQGENNLQNRIYMKKTDEKHFVAGELFWYRKGIIEAILKRLQEESR